MSLSFAITVIFHFSVPVALYSKLEIYENTAEIVQTDS